MTRASLTAQPVELLRPGRYWQPDLFVINYRDCRYVVKDYRHRPWFYRWGLGIVATWREAKNYRRLSGLQGVADFGGKVDRYAITLEYIPGRNADRFQRGELPPSFFEELRTIVIGIHERGVVLGDLRNSKNIMVSDSGHPYVIDFSTAFSRGGWWNPLQRWLYRVFEQDDFLGIAKLKRRYAPELLTEQERRGLEEGLPLEKPAHATRDALKSVIKKLFGPRKG